MRRVDLKLALEMKNSLGTELKEQNPTVPLRRVVQELLPEIKAAMKRGYTLEEIVKVISKKIPINEGTLRGYMYGKDRVDRPASVKPSPVKKKSRAK